MHQFHHVYESLRFLLIDIQKQLQAINDGLHDSDFEQFQKSSSRLTYIENAHLAVLNRTFQQSGNIAKNQQIQLQSFDHLSYSLLNFSNHLTAMSGQLQQLKSLKNLQNERVFNALSYLKQGLALIEPAIEQDEIALAIDICQFEARIHKQCQQQLKRNEERLKQGHYTPALMQSSLILRDIENMADTLLQVGEGILSGKLGQFIQIERLQTLEATLCDLDVNLTEHPIHIHSMGETKSGCTISSVTSSSQAQQEIFAVFKEGQETKLHEEKIGIEAWHEKFPGIAPEVYSYQKQGNKAALLFEYLSGMTLDKLLIHEPEQLISGLQKLFKTLEEIWQTTEQKQPIAGNFMQQLQKRLESVYDVHPEFYQSKKGLKLGSMQRFSLEALIKQATKLEKQLRTPNAVYIHGDFNVDNILYDFDKNELNFIDLHRSEYFDYVQDLSVLMVSFYRLRNFEPQVRHLIANSMQAIYEFGQAYALKNNDTDYAQRMALGLARSFISSTRFVLDKEHAKSMLFKGRYLLEQLINLPLDQKHHYQLSKELFHD